MTALTKLLNDAKIKVEKETPFIMISHTLEAIIAELKRQQVNCEGALAKAEGIVLGNYPLRTSNENLANVYYKNRDERLPEVMRADICFIQRQTSEDSRNAALISAAPEMLMALELILNDDRLMNALNKQQARAVIDSIAKATGSVE